MTDSKRWEADRSYDKHMDLLSKAPKNQGCIRKPAIPFTADQRPPDMLHMKKGIISKLINQVVDWTLLHHREEALIGEMKKHKIPFVYIF